MYLSITYHSIEFWYVSQLHIHNYIIINLTTWTLLNPPCKYPHQLNNINIQTLNV